MFCVITESRTSVVGRGAVDAVADVAAGILLAAMEGAGTASRAAAVRPIAAIRSRRQTVMRCLTLESGRAIRIDLSGIYLVNALIGGSSDQPSAQASSRISGTTVPSRRMPSTSTPGPPMTTSVWTEEKFRPRAASSS